MAAHARLSPSSAHRWMVCPGSVQAEEAYPDEATEWAAEGSVFHDLMAFCMEFDLDPYQFVGESWACDGFLIEITKEMVEFGISGLDFLGEQAGKIFVEHEVDLGAWLPGQFGTLDIGIVTDEWIGIWDWKYGQGLAVYPEDNEQLMLYALGFWDNVARHLTDATKFKFFIEQPRIPGAGGVWECGLDELLKFGEKAAAAGVATYDPNAPRKASLHGCYFCKAREDCAEFDRFNLELIGMKFEDLDSDEPPALPDPDTLTSERRSYLCEHAGMFKKFLEQVHSATLAHALAGDPTPGMKAVTGNRGQRRWEDEKAAESLLKRGLGVKKAFNQKLKSPTQAEKELGTRLWKEAEKLIVQDPGRPVLVPESDKREALEPVTSKFEDLDAMPADIDDLV